MRTPMERRGFRVSGFSLIELIVVVAIILIIAAIAIPRFLSSRMSANEAGVVSALRSFTAGQVAYQTTYQQGLAESLETLGPPPSGENPSAERANLIDPQLAQGARNGYVFLYERQDTNGDGQFDSFTVHANPVSPGVTGRKFFFVDQTNIIRFATDGPAGPASPPIPAG